MEDTIDFRRWAGPMENEFIEEWKADGGRVAGFFCAHAPEELLWAAGMLPVRMRGTGSEDTSVADQYFGAVNCGLVRHTLSRLFGGELRFLDALLLTNSCDHLRRFADLCLAKQPGRQGRLPQDDRAARRWLAPDRLSPASLTACGPESSVQGLFCHYVDVPHVNSEESLARLVAQLRVLRDRLQSSFSISITDQELGGAIKLYNQTRRLLSQSSALRAEDPPRLTGSELLAMAVAASSIPKDQFNALLERRLAQVKSEDGTAEISGPRLMIIGGALDDAAYLEVIESLGARIVADQLCWGAKSFCNETDENIDPIEAIARRMLDHIPCPRMLSDYPKRLASLVDAVHRYRVDGIICERLKFCDLWGGETEMLRRSVREELRIPLLVLERDYLTASSIGQLRTRVQAFLETLA